MGQGRGTPVHAYEVRSRKDHRGVSGPGSELSTTRSHGKPNNSPPSPRTTFKPHLSRRKSPGQTGALTAPTIDTSEVSQEEKTNENDNTNACCRVFDRLCRPSVSAIHSEQTSGHQRD